MVKFKDEGSGWHNEPGPHSQARTLGYVLGRKKKTKTKEGFDKEGYTITKPYHVSDEEKHEAHARWLRHFEQFSGTKEQVDFGFRAYHNNEIEEEQQNLMQQQKVEIKFGDYDNMKRREDLKELAVARVKERYGITGF